ncbi:hypothetical protein BCU70_03565 [Vibrio sp. 10N.286.49.C2]|uniref:CBS domain-containing protein n=1 Tax=unclassified Vibrio TaxID=2614977 RepID=UPI000C81E1B4|nr:hypothetical protein BCU70_03565 [Vibrio sp. 10N.286.49.C2]PMH55766.1 hypothetical protein BCU66_09160 [Vibrio sp. 10N.286.49.B1]PMH80794.1 hypothetical protein BCU58_22745 [Vibrio sp. 10N.286.48.B7]
MKNITVKQIMNNQPITLSTETITSVALDTLLDNNLTSAPVIDDNLRLIGFLSVHDVMVDLWCENYIPQEEQKVVDIMNRNVVSISSKETLVNVIEALSIDKEQLFPTTSMGYATSMTTLSLEERAKAMKVAKPQVLPVLEDGKLVGSISRLEVMRAVRPAYGNRLNVVNTDDRATA